MSTDTNKPTDKKFPCIKCGLCCRTLGKQIERAKSKKEEEGISTIDRLLVGFPYEPTKDGSCSMLVDNQCSVYDHRPALCDIKNYPFFAGVSEEENFSIQAEACNILLKEAGLSERVIILK